MLFSKIRFYLGNPVVPCRELRDVAQLGSALRSGRRGRRFKSCHPDSNKVNSGKPFKGLASSRKSSVSQPILGIFQAILAPNW
jgi:hypothetical protein